MISCAPFRFFAVLAVPAMLTCALGQTGRKVTISEMVTFGGEKEFSAVGEITVLPNREILVSDAYRYVIRRYTSGGKPLGKYGRRGRTNGSFESIPYFVRSGGGIVAVAEAGSAKLQIFRKDFSYIRTLYAPGPVVDFAITPHGNIFVNDLPAVSSGSVACLFCRGDSVPSALTLPYAETIPVLNMFSLENDGKGGCIAVAKYRNCIARYDSLGKITAIFRVPGMQEKAILNRSSGDESVLLPEGVLFHDVATTTDGTIFILGGDAAQHPEQDVYVLSPEGRLLTTMTLPERTGILYIDDKNFLYTRARSRTVVRKYSLTEHDSQ